MHHTCNIAEIVDMPKISNQRSDTASKRQSVFLLTILLQYHLVFDFLNIIDYEVLLSEGHIETQFSRCSGSRICTYIPSRH